MATEPVRVVYERWGVLWRDRWIGDWGAPIMFERESDARSLAHGHDDARPVRVRVTVEEVRE